MSALDAPIVESQEGWPTDAWALHDSARHVTMRGSHKLSDVGRQQVHGSLGRDGMLGGLSLELIGNNEVVQTVNGSYDHT